MSEEAKPEEAKQLTVADLIEKLRTMPQDLPVLADGCDCWGEAFDVSIVEAGQGWGVRSVLVSRS